MEVAPSSQSLASEVGEDECRLVDLLGVVLAQLVLFLLGPAAEWLLDVGVGVLTADHEADLTGWVSRDGGVSILDGGEYFLAGFLKLSDEGHVKPLVLSCSEQVSIGTYALRKWNSVIQSQGIREGGSQP
jgi:hypothetical protein